MTEPTELRQPDVRYEHTDINARGVVLTGFGIIVSALVIVCLTYFVFAYFRAFEVRQGAAPLPIARPFPPEPRLQLSPSQDLQEMQSAAESTLRQYRWIDRKQNTVTIPIDRAMDLIVQRGISSQRAPKNKNIYFEPRAGDRLTGFEGKGELEPR